MGKRNRREERKEKATEREQEREREAKPGRERAGDGVYVLEGTCGAHSSHRRCAVRVQGILI